MATPGNGDSKEADQSVRAFLVVGLLWLALVIPVRGDTRLTLAIPAQPLGLALDSFGRQSGMAVLVDQALLGGLRSSPINGRYTPREGLQRLLLGTGLEARYSAAQGFTLRPLRLQAPAARERPGGTGAGSYARALQQAVEQALCVSALTRPGSYRAALQVWIDASGQLVQSRLLATTGDFNRDAALVERLRAVRLQRAPPTSLAQPVTLLLRPGPMDCPLSQGAAAA
ncbi:TonB-dependent outer membrane receptor [Pantoea sp. Tr-811]|uniref:STN domain-containing protein n=1 Tax=unclassified Pantoea TaxID=2630326 RepID=UPI0014239B45|nr:MULTISPECIES: STN domain-containing protein [unclassified Pantoea]NIE78523.1 TonB-dependent outer membrane receptor [Pantoea sp. Ap-967]NIF25121.1 TonB-dependent outer membrane receptor [Pantoea sp. Tr-811]